MNTLEAATGKWRGILSQLGLEDQYLRGPRVHGPCPLCGGVDRYRFDNQDGRGTYFCNACGPGTGMQLLQKWRGWDFATAAKAVDDVIGNVQTDQIKPAMSDEKRRDLLRKLWRAGVVMDGRDPASLYLHGRGCLPKWITPDLRYVAECPAPDGVKRLAMIALVRDALGNPCNIHRTFFNETGKAKRAIMPGPLPEGSAVRLFKPGVVMGIAEGIETAYAAAKRFQIPVWSAINAGNLAKWQAPEGCEGVKVFGDCDPKYGGQAAAYALAHRLAVKGLAVEVHIPDTMGKDWADDA
jgi:putative DNA primase/helicase